MYCLLKKTDGVSQNIGSAVAKILFSTTILSANVLSWVAKKNFEPNNYSSSNRSPPAEE